MSKPKAGSQIYKTGLISCDVPEDVRLRRYKARGWELIFKEDRFIGQVATNPGKTSRVTNEFAKWERRIAADRKRRRYGTPMISVTEYGAHAGSEILIRAKDRETAQEAFNLILLSEVLLDSERLCVGHDMDRRIFPATSAEFVPEDTMLPSFHAMGTGLMQAALVAARLSQKAYWQTAAWRYYQSLTQHYSCVKRTHPYRGDYQPVSRNPKQYIPYGTAIHLAYSVFEDLKLEVRASATKPSTVNGVQNPIVWNELRNRLIKAGVDPDWKVVWRARTRTTRITKAKKPAGNRADWAWREVQDRMVPTIDAIFYLSFLRSKAGAHGRTAFTRSLSVYDVENAQQLAWCVLLQAIGCG